MDDDDDTTGDTATAPDPRFTHLASNEMANFALSAAELERRLSLYESRAARRLPLFDDSKRPVPAPPRSHRYGECFGCGCAAPPPNSVARRAWYMDRLDGFGPNGSVGSCSYCPACWPAHQIDRARRFG